MQIAYSMWYGEIGNLGCIALAVSCIVWISPGSPSDLLYRLNCHVDQQPVVGNLFFAELWIAGNSFRSNQIMSSLKNKAFV